MGQGETQQLTLFPSQVEPPPNDPQVARVLLNKVRLERSRQFGSCWLGLELWKRLELDHFFEQAVDEHEADVPWSRVVAVLAINRLGSKETALSQSDFTDPWRRPTTLRFGNSLAAGYVQ
jgi:hypothetical protein